LALLLGCPCGALLSLPLLLRSSCLFLRVPLLLRSGPRSLLLCRTRCLLLLRRGSGGLLLCGARSLLLRGGSGGLLLCGTRSLLLLCGGPRAILCLSLLSLFSTWGVRDESERPKDKCHQITAKGIHGAVLFVANERC
jgi:hypothetical protein